VRSTDAIAVLLAAVPMAAITSAAPTPPATAPAAQIASDHLPTIDSQIARLGDADPTVRQLAADWLVHLGAAARPAVLAASRGDDPQIADGATQVLRSLPWSMPDDPPEVKKLLDPYGSATVADRIGIVAQLAELPESQPALLRLLSDESNEDVCWQIEQELIQRPNAKTFAAARQLDPQTSRPAALVLAAHAWLTPLPPAATGIASANAGDRDVDRDRASAMLRRAVALEAVAPTYDDGQLDFAFDQLAASAVDQHRYEDAAKLRRQQCKRIGVTRTTFPSPFFELLILHADFGPLHGFQDDLKTYDTYAAAPESLFILSRLYSRLGQSLTARALEQAGLCASISVDSRSAATDFLIEHGWDDLACKECRATLARADATPDRDDVNARLRLSSLAANRGDEQQAADQLRMALADHKISGGELTMTRGDRVISGAEAELAMQIELAQHALHAAQAKGDAAEVGREVDELMRLGPNDAEAALDLVPELRTRGRTAEADKLFQSAYAPLRARIDAGETDPTLMNEIAWLCARCNEHLDEALDLSNRAVAAEPSSAAYLDTNAEAHFRKGQAAEAARLEGTALKYQPGDPFMEGQLKRFQAGVDAKKEKHESTPIGTNPH
jgi:tetratricopeptide (TPR) repeat protein